MLRTSRIAWLILLTLVMAGSRSAGAQPPQAGKIIHLQGQVMVRPSGTEKWVKARINQELGPGDAIRTGPASRTAILCVDESQIQLQENTTIILKEIVPSPHLQAPAVTPAILEKPPASLYQVPNGEIWLRNKNEKFRFELETPVITATIRGTEFVVRVQPDGITTVTLLEGQVWLINPLGELCLQPGEEGFASPGKGPSKRVLVQPADAAQWVLYYPGIFSYRDLPLSPRPGETRLPASPPPLAALIQQGEAAYDQGNLPEAEAQAKAVLAQAPDNGRALTLMGWVRLQHNAPEEALGYFRRVRDADDRTIIGMALCRYRLGDLTGAYELVQAASQKLRPAPFLLTMAGYFAMLAGQIDKAVSQLEAASRQLPDAALPRALLAQIYLVQNRKDAALSEANTALSQSPNSPVALLSLALVKMSQFDLPAAIPNLQKALAADPRFVDAYVYLAKIWLGSEYLGWAQQTVDQARQLAPQDAEVLSLAGFVRLAYRDYTAAQRLFLQASEFDPSLGEPHLGLATYHFRHRNFTQGLTEMLTATLLDPRLSQYQSQLGKALYQAHAFDKALEVWDYAKSLDPKDPTPHLYKGIALTDLNRPGEAIQEINKSIELNDNVAMFRARQSLDQDLAVRNAGLARAYQQLGLTEWALS
ncbi:MAG: tetratricopeptide repeat protein, partial [Desulfobacteraceae bacterium]